MPRAGCRTAQAGFLDSSSQQAEAAEAARSLSWRKWPTHPKQQQQQPVCTPLLTRKPSTPARDTPTATLPRAARVKPPGLDRRPNPAKLAPT